jgi:DNA polymerase elongation subunit (family B)
MQMIFDGESFEACFRHVQKVVRELTSGVYPHADFVITKSVKPLGTYKRRVLCTSDDKKRKKQLADCDVSMTLHCNDLTQIARKFDFDELEATRKKVAKQKGKACTADLDADVLADYSNHVTHRYGTNLQGALESLIYEFRSLPAVVQLGEKMRYRGCIVQAGSRIEYVIINTPDSDSMKLWKKVEERSYFVRHSDVLSIDCLYYLKLLVNPIDELMFVAFKKKNVLMQLFKALSLPHAYEKIEIEIA